MRWWVLGLGALGSLVLQAGCTTGSSPFGSASEVDKRFVVAAITWDLSRDGDVTCREWKQYATALFDEADANHNGALNREEFAAMARRDRLFETVDFAYLDTQRDGNIARGEVVDRRNPAFALMDANNDCVLTPEERARPQAKTSTL
jgi:hypothetical protein